MKQDLLVNFFRARYLSYLTAILLTIAANVAQARYPDILGRFTDELQQLGMAGADVVRCSLELLAVGLLSGILASVGQYLIMKQGRRFEAYARRRLFLQFLSLNGGFHARHGVGKLLSYLMNDVTAVRESLSRGLLQTVNAVILVGSAVAMMLAGAIPLGLIAVCVLPLLLIPWVVNRFGPVVRERSLAVQESLGKMTEAAEEQFGGIRVCKTFAVEPVMHGRFGETVDSIQHNQLRLVRVSSLFQAAVPFLASLSLVAAIAFGGYMVVREQITLGNFVALTLYIRMMTNPLQQIGNVINLMQRSRASLERLNDLLVLKPEICEAAEAGRTDFSKAEIRFANLSFAYPDARSEALLNVSFTVAPGKTVGIIGKTGSGKSTLVKLLLRMNDPPRGTVFIGNTDVRDISMECLRSQIAYVPQDGFLFSTTIRDNIAFFDRESGLDQVEAAAREAHIYDAIKQMPEHFETRLGERGITLSGGQRQRTSLARGMIKHAPVMIMDDSVSAVDTVTERLIIASVRRERKNKTTLLIAHRISAIRHADEIIVMDRGRVVQRGTHQELLSRPGVYAKLHSIQEGEGKRREDMDRGEEAIR